MTAAEQARDAYGVLVCLGAAVCEEEGIDVAGCDLRELQAQTRAHLGSHERVGIRKRRSLPLNSTNHSLVAVSDVDAHQLAIEVDKTLALWRPEVDSFRARDRNRIHCRLRGPFEERVPAAEIDDLLTRHGIGNGSHIAAMLLKSRTIDNVKVRSLGGSLSQYSCRGPMGSVPPCGSGWVLLAITHHALP